ncbi:restriction endonuclease subunit S [Aeromonas taiwanensis]
MTEQMMQETAGKTIPAGYKQTEVGVIPEDWDVCELQEAVEFLDGQRRPIKSGDRAKIAGIYPYYGASGIVDYVNDYIFDEQLILLGEDGENILSRNVPLAFKVSGKIWVNNHAHVLKPKEDFHIGYLTELLESIDYSLLNSGTAQPKLNKQTCQKIKVIKPRHKEQTAIANVLSDSDALIDALEQLIAKKQAIKSATMQQLLTGRTRLPQFALREDGTPKGTKPSELGEIPEDWEVGAIGDSCRTYSGGTPSTSNKNFYGGGIKWITSSDLNQGVIHDVAGRITDAGLNGSSAKLVEAHTLLIALYGATAGVCAITRISAAINQAVLAIVPAEHNSEYLFYWFTRHKEVIIETYTQGGQPNLSGDIVRSIKLAFPPVNEQTAIATILSDMDAEIQALEQRLGKTLQIKQGMMQELLTGKTRLIKPSKEVIHE